MDSIKKKIFDISSIGATDGIGAGIAAIFWFYIASELGPENYGELTYLISIAALVSGIALFGSHNTMLVLTGKKIDIQSTIYLLTIITNVTGAIIVFLIFHNIGISLVVIAYAMFSLVTFDLLGRKWYRGYLKYVILQKALLVVFGVGLYYLIGENGILIGIALSHAHLAYQIIKSVKNSKINFNIIKERKEFVLNNFALSITGTFYGSIDKIIIAPLLGFAILGNYSLALQFFAIVNLLPSLANKFFTSQEVSGIPNTKLKKIVILMSIGVAALGSTIGPTVISYIFPKFVESEAIIQIISWSVVPMTIQASHYYPKLWAQEKNRYILFSTIVLVTIQIIGIVTLGPIYQGVGIALALLISNIGAVIFTTIITKFMINIADKN